MTETSKAPERTCLNCGANIDHKRPQAHFCDTTCKTQYHNKEKAKNQTTTAKTPPKETKPKAVKASPPSKKTVKPAAKPIQANQQLIDILDDLIPLSQAKDLLHVQKQTLYKWRKQGILTIYAITDRKHYVKRSDLIKLIKPIDD